MKGTNDVDAIAYIFTVFLPDHGGVYYHFLLVGILLEDIEPSDLSPIDLGPIEDVHVGSIKYFDSVGDIGAVNECCVVSEA